MKKLAFLLVALAAAAAPAGAQTVETGTTQWDQLPPAKLQSVYPDYGRLVRWAEQVLRSEECRAAGLKAEKFDVDARYAALVEPNGTVRRIIISEMGCPGLNTVIGSTVYQWAKDGKFRPTGQPEALWFGGRLSFAGESTTNSP